MPFRPSYLLEEALFLLGKKILKAVCIVFAAVLILAGGLVIFLTAAEWKPKPAEPVDFMPGGKTLSPGDELTVLTWNLGYAGLGKESEFIFDGGGLYAPSKEQVSGYFDGICSVLAENKADVRFLQEIDRDSARSYHIDMISEIETLLDIDGAYARNYSCVFEPVPVPTVGKVDSGIATFSGLETEDAVRIQLPVPFDWPSRTVNLKRCLLAEHVSLEGTDQELVLVNLHLEAYDDGEGKAEQTAVLMEYLEAEYAKGNYIICGGDFNQTFLAVDETVCPTIDESFWMPGLLTADLLPEGWSYVYDSSAPTCRLNNKPYDGNPETTQYYIIDGFIVSPNVTAKSVETLDYAFQYSDHQPVAATFRLEPPTE